MALDGMTTPVRRPTKYDEMSAFNIIEEGGCSLTKGNVILYTGSFSKLSLEVQGAINYLRNSWGYSVLEVERTLLEDRYSGNRVF